MAKKHTFPKGKLTQLILSALTLFAFAGVCFHEASLTKNRFEETLKLWTPQLSQALLSGDGTFLENFALGMTVSPFSQIEFYNAEKKVLTFPQLHKTASCFLQKEVPLLHQGFRVGKATACFSVLGVSRRILISPFFLFLCMGALILIWFISRQLLVAESSLKKAGALSQLATQVAHDLRSPLAALEVAVERFSTLPPEERILVAGAIGRIQGIAQALLEKHRSPQSDSPSRLKVHSLTPLVEQLIREKIIQFSSKPELQIEFESKVVGASSVVDASEFQRVLSNLLDNAAEAILGGGKIKVTLGLEGTHTLLTIQDDGAGIPEPVISSLFHQKVTFGKEKGNGLGLLHAKTQIENWNGTISLESKIHNGTTVKILIPNVLATTQPESECILIEDNPFVQTAWKYAAEALNKKLYLFSDPSSFLAQASEFKKNVQIFIDCDLGDEMNGEELSKKLYEMGFENLILSTGLDESDTERNPWIKAVIGKTPPWGKE